eukprot:2781973-Amphidinium_carterae.1
MTLYGCERDAANALANSCELFAPQARSCSTRIKKSRCAVRLCPYGPSCRKEVWHFNMVQASYIEGFDCYIAHCGGNVAIPQNPST